MIEKRRRSAPIPTGRHATLAEVVIALGGARELSRTRVRDLVSAVQRVAALLGNEPGAITVDVSALGARLATINPVAVGITPKRLTNLRSDFLAALKASGLIPAGAFRKSPLSRAWLELFEVAFRPARRDRPIPSCALCKLPVGLHPNTSMMT